jgi:hypothetical protein
VYYHAARTPPSAFTFQKSFLVQPPSRGPGDFMSTVVYGLVFGLNGGTATVDFGGENTVTTDAGGEFQITLPNGTYTASATASTGATLSPASLQVVVDNQDYLLVAGGFWAAPIVQAINASFAGNLDGGASNEVSFPNPLTEGNSIIIVAQSVSSSSSEDYGVNPALLISDTQGLAFNKVAPTHYGVIGGGVIFQSVQDCYLATSVAAGSDTIQITQGAYVPSSDIYIFEVAPTLLFCAYGTYNNPYDQEPAGFEVTTSSPYQGLALAAVCATPGVIYDLAVSSGWQPISDLFVARGCAVSSQLQGAILFTNSEGGSSTVQTPAVATLWLFAPLYSISGNAGVAGAIVSYSGQISGSVVAGSGGAFSIGGLPGENIYTISVSLSGYSFAPSYQNVTITAANVAGVNFTATANTPSSSRFTFIEDASPAAGATTYNVIDGASTNSLGRTTAGSGAKVGTIFWDNVVAQAWSFNLQSNMPFIAAGSTDAADIESFATSLAAPVGITPVQPAPTPSTRFAFTAVRTKSGQTPLVYLVSDGPSIAYGSIAQIVWDGVFARWCFIFTNDSAQIESPADVACITSFVASLAPISPNQISL